MIKAIIVGYPGSQSIVPASEYLIGKYVVDYSTEIFPIFLNHAGPVSEWAPTLSKLFKLLPDKLVMFALDDYLVSGPLDLSIYEQALRCMEGDPVRGDPPACVKLCHATAEENEEYPVTTQWTIWRRQTLTYLLDAVRTPWEFEIIGSTLFKKLKYRALHAPCIPYFTNSAISSRWEGVRLDGLTDPDRTHVEKLITL